MATQTSADAGMLAGKRAIITGAGRNVGRAIAELFVSSGATVAIVDLDAERGQQTLASVNAIRAEAGTFIACDVSAEDSVRQMVDDAVGYMGGVDILINCVAITDRPSTVLDLDLDRWNAVMNISVTSVFLCTKFAGQKMVEQGTGGAIVNIGSTSGHRGRVNATAYGPAKAAVLNMGMNSASQLGPHGIRVNTVTPNTVGSPVGQDEEPANRKRTNVLGRGCEPIDVANAVRFLASDEASFITASELLVDGGSLYGATS